MFLSNYVVGYWIVIYIGGKIEELLNEWVLWKLVFFCSVLFICVLILGYIRKSRINWCDRR